MVSQADAAEKVRETRVGAEGIKEGMDFEELKDIGLLCVGSLEPGEGLVIITEA